MESRLATRFLTSALTAHNRAPPLNLRGGEPPQKPTRTLGTQTRPSYPLRTNEYKPGGGKRSTSDRPYSSGPPTDENLETK